MGLYLQPKTELYSTNSTSKKALVLSELPKFYDIWKISQMKLLGFIA